MGKLMQKLGVTAKGRSDRGDGKYYELPEANEFRARFAKHLGHEVGEIFD
jgi:putative DNA primase/helicase